MTQQPLISVVIPVYNGSSTLSSCLDALLDSDYSNYEILVADDASSDDSVSVAQAKKIRVLESENSRPQGAATARNRGAEAAVGEILFFTDSDVLVKPDTLSHLVSNFQKHPEIQAIMGSYTRDTPVTNFSSRFKNYLHHYTHQNSHEEAITFWTACGGIYRDTFMSVGGFNESYDAATVEDIAFGYKLTRVGHSILLVKDLQVQHMKQYTLTNLIYSDVMCRAVPWTRLMIREKTFRSDLNTSFSSALGLVAAYLMLPALVMLPFSSLFLVPLFLLAALFIWLNISLYQDISKTENVFFIGRFVGMSYLYYLYSGLGLMIAIIGFFVFNRKY